jgi:hypothetical protein
MSDLPLVLLQQQANAVPRTGEDLEVMGKHAALNFLRRGGTLTTAVVETVKHAGLSPEQVRRVTEFANVNAYLTEFNKEGESRYVEFEGGPASPAAVLQELNAGGSEPGATGSGDYTLMPYEKVGSVYSSSTGTEKVAANHRFGPSETDYAYDMVSDIARGHDDVNWGVPSMYSDHLGKARVHALAAHTGRSPVVVKTASGPLDFDVGETMYREVFKPVVEPLNGEVGDEYTKLAADLSDAAEYALSEVSSLEVGYQDALEGLYQEVKTAALDGVTLGQIMGAWRGYVPDATYIKTAFMHVGPRLIDEGVFNGDSFGASLQKTAAAGLVNPEHPLVTGVKHYCDTLYKLASKRAAYEELREYAGQAKKQASIWGSARDLAGGFAPKAEAGTHAVLTNIIGEGGAARGLSKAVGTGVKYAPHAAVVLGINELLNRMKHNRLVRSVAGLVPGTQANEQHLSELQMQSGSYPSGGVYY